MIDEPFANFDDLCVCSHPRYAHADREGPCRMLACPCQRFQVAQWANAPHLRVVQPAPPTASPGSVQERILKAQAEEMSWTQWLGHLKRAIEAFLNKSRGRTT